MKKQNTKQIIGILGGMGPQASAYLLELIINLSIKMGAKNNNDFPEILLDSISVPDFIENVKNRKIVSETLKKRTIFLNKLQLSCLSIACNTAHLLLSDLQKVSKAPFVSMIEEVANVVAATNLKKVGILGTPVTIEQRLYQKALGRFAIKSIEPYEIELGFLEGIIRKVIAGLVSHKDRALLLSIADYLRERGAQGIILGCTELPLVFPKNQSYPVFNSLEILAIALLKRVSASGRNCV